MTDQAIRVVPAGWYEDPADPTSVRWWNGVGWTEHTNLKPGAVTPSPQVEDRRPEGDASRGASTTAAPLTRRAAIAAEHEADPARAATGLVWLIALIPVIAFALALVALYLHFYVVQSPLWALLALVPYLLGLLWAVSDRRTLVARGFEPASALWALLTPLGYLIARRTRVPGSGPLLLLIITLVVALVAPTAYVLTPIGRPVTLALRVQNAVETQLVKTGELESATCPPFVESTVPGTLFTCDAVSSAGTPTTVWVSIDNENTFSIAPSV